MHQGQTGLPNHPGDSMNTQAKSCTCTDCIGAACTCGCQSAAPKVASACGCGCQQGKPCQCGPREPARA